MLVALEEWAHCRKINPGTRLRGVADESSNHSESPQTNVSLRPEFDRIVGYQLGRDGPTVATRPSMTFMGMGRYILSTRAQSSAFR